MVFLKNFSLLNISFFLVGSAGYVFVPLQSHAVKLGTNAMVPGSSSNEGSSKNLLDLPEAIIRKIASMVIEPSDMQGPGFAVACKNLKDVTNSTIRKIFFKIPTLDKDNSDALKKYFSRYLDQLTSLESLTFWLTHHQTTPGILTRLAETLSEKLSGRTKFIDLTFDLLDKNGLIREQTRKRLETQFINLDTITLTPKELMSPTLINQLASLTTIELTPAAKIELIADLTQALTIHINKLIHLRSLTINLEIEDVNFQQAKELLIALSKFKNIEILNLNLKINSTHSERAKELATALKSLTKLTSLTITTAEKNADTSHFRIDDLLEELQHLKNLRSLILILRKNYIFLDEVEKLAEGLKRLIKLRTLNIDLTGNYLNDAGAHALATAFGELRELNSVTLNLADNNITSVGENALTTVLDSLENLKIRNITIGAVRQQGITVLF